MKQNLSKEAYRDYSSNKVIELPGSAAQACFGSGQGRFDEQEKLLAKQPTKLGPGAYSKINFESKGKNFSTRFVNSTSGNI